MCCGMLHQVRLFFAQKSAPESPARKAQEPQDERHNAHPAENALFKDAFRRHHKIDQLLPDGYSAASKLVVPRWAKLLVGDLPGCGKERQRLLARIEKCDKKEGHYEEFLDRVGVSKSRQSGQRTSPHV